MANAKSTQSLNAFKEQKVTRIPFGKLKRWSGNVRTVKPSSAADKELVANIRTNGVLQALVVFKDQNGSDSYLVAAGGRRYGSLEVLFAEGQINENTLIDCNEVDEKDALAISLSENLKESMHPADSFAAYSKLISQGKTVSEIAKQFGKSSKEVEKLLKLSAVAPEIIEAFKEDKISLDCVMAFTVSDDQSRQLECFNTNKRNLHPSNIRSILLATTVRSDDKLVTFVGLDAYKKAGGTITSDMFNTKVVYLNDIELLNELASQKLQEAADNLFAMGWSWVRTDIGFHEFHKFRSENGELVGVPDEINTKIAELENEQNELYALDESTEEQDERMSAIEDELEALEESKEAYRQFTPAQLSFGGCAVFLDGAGGLVVRKGLFTKDAHAEYLKSINPVAEGSEAATKAEKSELESKGTESEALLVHLGDYKAQAIQADLAKNCEVAFDLMVFSMADRLLSFNYASPMDMRPNKRAFTAGDIESTKAGVELSRIYAELPLNWMEIEDDEERFQKFSALKKSEKASIMSYCVAISTTTGAKHESGVMSALLKSLSFDLNKYWAPTTENYFSRVSKDTLLSIGGELEGEEWTKKSASAKKSELAKLLPTLDKIKGWLPVCMR